MFRPQEQTQPADAYTFTREGQKYTVILFRLHNSTNGCPRYKAVISWFDETEQQTGARVYHFRGSYSHNRTEANEILDYMLSQFNKGE